MSQLFDDPRQLQLIPMPDGDVRFMQLFYPPQMCHRYFDTLFQDTAWQQETIQIWGKERLQPRLTAWHGDAGKSYTYSGLHLQPQPWTPALHQIRQDVEKASGHRFNSVLLNLYRNEHDSVSWHSDDEAELGRCPVIASLSFGETRKFCLRHKKTRQRLSFDLNDGSLLLMAGSTQRHWMHAVEKERTPKGPRINLTFRQIMRR